MCVVAAADCSCYETLYGDCTLASQRILYTEKRMFVGWTKGRFNPNLQRVQGMDNPNFVKNTPLDAIQQPACK